MSRKNWSDEKIFSRLLTNKTENTYWENIRELRHRPSIEIFQRSCELARSDDDKKKRIGIDVLAQLGFNPRFNSDETVKLYFELLSKKQTGAIVASILYGIGHNNENLTDEQISTLIDFRTNSSSDIRSALVYAFLGVNHSKAIQTLIELTRDKITDVRNWATFGIGTRIETNNAEIINALWNRLKDKDQETRFEAIVGLAHRNDHRVKDIIFQELEKQDYGSLLFEAIIILKDKDFLPLLEGKLKLAQREECINNGWRFALEGTIEELKNESEV